MRIHAPMRRISPNHPFSWWITVAIFLISIGTLTAQGSITASQPDLQCKTLLDSTDIKHWIRELPGSHHQYNEDEFLFGEEFEFWIDEPIVPPDPATYAPPYPNNIASSQSMLMKWHNALVTKLKTLGINDFKINGYLNDGYVSSVSKYWMDVQIGEWRNIVYIDGWHTPDDKGLALLEVNTSPYKMYQKFKVDKKRYTAYQLFDLFIFDIAKELGLTGASGHKHLDLRDSVGGNQELLFRMLVDVEDKAWISQVFGCEEDTGMKIGCFVYRSQNWENQTCSSVLQTQVKHFNEGLLSGLSRAQSRLSPGNALQQVMRIWRCTQTPAHKRPDLIQILPMEIRIALRYAPETVTNELAKQGKVIVHPQSGTAEFRFLPSVENGKEVLLINKMMRNWFRYQAKRQREGSPIIYEPYDPLSNEETPESLKKRFTAFIKSIGLKPRKYQALHRKGCARSTYNYYDL